MSQSLIDSAAQLTTPGTRPTMLVVLAHPDDESFGAGGTLALYADRGVNVHLICATGGEEGEMAPKYLEGYTDTADRRRAELECAARALGLSSVIMLGHRDSGMAGSAANKHPEALAAQPREAVAAQVVHHIRRLRPQVVVTFDPIGGYRHPDHIAIQQATVDAFHAAGDPRHRDPLPPYQPQKLYFSTFSRTFLRLVVSIMPLFGRDPRRIGVNKDVDLVALTEVDFPIHARVDVFTAAAARERAAACHASQGGGQVSIFSAVGRILRLFGGADTYMRAYPEAPAGLQERDLFEGVRW